MSAFSRTLTHTCTLQTAVITRSATGREQKAWSDSATGVQCRFWQNANRRADPRVADVYRSEFLMTLLPATTITTANRVTNVVLEDGTTYAGPFIVESILPRRKIRGASHTLVGLEKVEVQP